MRFAVTGANGFVGQAMTNELARRGYDVRAAARKEIGDLSAGVRWCAAPGLERDSDWSTVVEGMDVVIHCAARVHVMQESSIDPLAAFRRANRDGTMALARAAATAGVKRLVFISSVKVNGESTAGGRGFTEADEPAPLDPYGISKAEAEAALRELSASSGLEVTIIRPVLVYGPGVKANFAALLRAVERGIPLPLGAISNQRSLIYLGNLVDLAICAASHANGAGQTFLASDGEDISTTQLLRRIGTALDSPAQLIPLPASLLRLAACVTGRGALADRLTGSLTVDIAKARDILGWTPPYSVGEGLAATTAAMHCSVQHPS